MPMPEIGYLTCLDDVVAFEQERTSAG